MFVQENRSILVPILHRLERKEEERRIDETSEGGHRSFFTSPSLAGLFRSFMRMCVCVDIHST